VNEFEHNEVDVEFEKRMEGERIEPEADRV